MKRIAKAIANLVCLGLVGPLAVPLALLGPIDGSDKFFQFSSQLMSLFPGIPGEYLRRAFYRISLKCSPPGPTVCFGTIFAQRDTTLGERVYIGAFCNIGSSHVGNDVLIGSNVMIASPKIHHIDDCNVPISQQGGTIAKIKIGAGCWLGNGSIILADVDADCVIGAGSIVVKPCDANGIYVGNPARLLRYREAKEMSMPPHTATN